MNGSCERAQSDVWAFSHVRLPTSDLIDQGLGWGDVDADAVAIVFENFAHGVVRCIGLS